MLKTELTEAAEEYGGEIAAELRRIERQAAAGEPLDLKLHSLLSCVVSALELLRHLAEQLSRHEAAMRKENFRAN
jgi:hypothetical protein